MSKCLIGKLRRLLCRICQRRRLLSRRFRGGEITLQLLFSLCCGGGHSTGAVNHTPPAGSYEGQGTHAPGGYGGGLARETDPELLAGRVLAVLVDGDGPAIAGGGQGGVTGGGYGRGRSGRGGGRDSARDAGRHHAGFGGGIEHEIAHTLAVHGSALGWVAHVVVIATIRILESLPRLLSYAG